MDLLVDRTDLHATRVIDPPSPPLAEGQVRLGIERFALTANNITYAVTGDLLAYWDFFPADPPWGRVPVWGFAEILESRHPDVAVGTRVYGLLPMSDELVVTVGRADESGFTDAAPHRAPMAAAYNRYSHAAPDNAPGSTAESLRMALYPLFFTSFLVDDFLADAEFFGADVLVISSGSSKTGLGIAYLASQREGVDVVALTSTPNVDFVSRLGVYDHVVTYDAVDELPGTVAAYVDVSGSAPVRAAIRGRFGSTLAHDMALGATHHGDVDSGASAVDTAGAAPEFFFAPTQIALRNEQWGRGVLDERAARAWDKFAEWAGAWMEIRHAEGGDAVAQEFLSLLDNRSDPKSACIATLRAST